MLEEVAELLRGGSGATLSARMGAIERRLGELEGAGGGESFGPPLAATVPKGGTLNQALVKKSGTNYDTTWKGPVVFTTGLAGGQEIIGGTAAADKLILRGTSGSATDSVEWHFLLKGPRIEAERLTLFGERVLENLATLKLAAGTFQMENERWVIGPPLLKLPHLKITGTVGREAEPYEAFDTTNGPALGMLPEGGAAVIVGAKGALSKDRVICLINLSETETLTIEHESVEAAESERFSFASEEAVKLKPGEVLWLWFVEGNEAGAKARWRDVAGASLAYRKPRATIANPIEELKSVREKLEAVIAALKAWKIIE